MNDTLRRWRKTYRDHRGARGQQKSGRVPPRLRRACFVADRHRCVWCGNTGRLHADHVIPWIVGGPTALSNLVTLCQRCNTVKSCYWMSPSGKVYYRGRSKPPLEAVAIYARECAVRRSPMRWVRAAWALAT